jgi:chloramphenicol-sensitive protein RarD
MKTQSVPDNRGLLLAAGAYLSWVIFPIYFRTLQIVPPMEILAHRVVWSVIFLTSLLTWMGNWRWLGPAVRSKHTMLTYGAASALLGVNWYIYIWAVNHGFILEGSLGYFINPLVSVLLGVVFLHERLRSGQIAAILLAGVGVLFLTIMYGQPPWIALSLAVTFGLYGLIKKRAPLPAAPGLTLETAFLFPLAFSYLLWMERSGTGAFIHAGGGTTFLLAISGVITAVPLMMFAAAAQRIPLTLLGVMQYIAPTGQFLVAVFVFDEPFPPYKLVGFSIIWTALIIFSVEGYMTRRRAMQLASSPTSA